MDRGTSEVATAYGYIMRISSARARASEIEFRVVVGSRAKLSHISQCPSIGSHAYTHDSRHSRTPADRRQSSLITAPARGFCCRP